MAGRALISLVLLVTGCSTLKPTYDWGDGKTNTLAAAFSSDQRFVAAADSNGMVRVWDTGTGREVGRCAGFDTTHRTYCQRRLIFSPADDLVAFAAADNTVRLWNWRDGLIVRKLSGHPRPPVYIVCTADNHVVALSGGYGYVTAAASTRCAQAPPT